MKNTWIFVISGTLSITLLILLSSNLTIGNKTLPALGHFVNPFTGFWIQAESGKAGSHEKYTSSFLDDSVQIEFDERMVPHIFAQNSEDAFYAQGFMHAKNRLFQMDLINRSITGRLSEILGEQTLEKDIFARRINFLRAIENKYQSWRNHPDMMILSNAYVQGVNDYINSLEPQNYPLEYKLLGATPEKWTIQKLISISISLTATLNMDLKDFERTYTAWNIGPELFGKLFPVFPDTILPIDINRTSYPDSAPALKPQKYQSFEYLHEQLPPDPGPGIGSNNWAVRAAMTKDSIPMLANDPHLRLTLPSVWYELEIHTPEYTTHGVSVPGLPSIIIGFNQHIAWGQTNTQIDVLDTYKIKWKDKKRGIYMLDGEEKQANLRKEIIKIKGKPPHIEEVYDTYWGPVLFGDEESERQSIAVKWMSYFPNENCDLRTFYGLMKVENLEDYQDAIKNLYVPGQNIAFASTDDSIAITVQGKFPVKRPGQGRFIMDGSLTSNDWQGIIPQEDLPRMINPERNYVYSANQWPTYPEYPYYYTGKFDHYRGRTIGQFLESNKPLTVEKMKMLQNSVFNLKTSEILPVLLDFIPDSPPFTGLRDSLMSWNYNYQPENTLPTFSELWIKECIMLSFDEIRPIDSLPMMEVNEWRLYELLQNPRDTIFDMISTQNVQETAGDIVLAAWYSAKEKFDNIPENDRRWGKYAGLSIMHLLGIPEFSRQNLFTGGNGNTVNATTETNGPSWRMIVELSKDSISGHVIYPGGQSGNPGSQYYDNFIEDWLDGKYYKVKLAKDPQSVSHTIHYSIHLLPK